MIPPSSPKRTPVRNAVIALSAASAVAATAGCTTTLEGTGQPAPASQVQETETPSAAPSSAVPSASPTEVVAGPATALPEEVELNPFFEADHMTLVNATRRAGATMNGLTEMKGQVMLLILAQTMTGRFDNEISAAGIGMYGVPPEMIESGRLPGINSEQDALDIDKMSMAIATLYNEAGFCDPSDINNLAALISDGVSPIPQAEADRFTNSFASLEGGVVTPVDLQPARAECTYVFEF